MTAIDKRYWKWNAQHSVDSIKLGDSIDDILERGLIFKKNDQADEYEGSNGVPWKVNHKDGRVISVFFREIFFDFIEPGIWECDVEDFTKKVDSVLEPIRENISGARLRVVFRGGFVAIAGIEKNESTTINKNNA